MVMLLAFEILAIPDRDKNQMWFLCLKIMIYSFIEEFENIYCNLISCFK
jgi:hypothetical protein